MKIRLETGSNIECLPEPIKSAVYRNMKSQLGKTSSGENNSHGFIDINTAFTWNKSLEMSVYADADTMWSELYQGEEVIISQEVLDFWDYKGPKEFMIEKQENNVYYGTYNKRKVKIEITYLDESE